MGSQRDHDRATAGSASGAPPDTATFAGLDLLANAVVMVDREGTLLFMNDAAEELLEVSLRRARGQPFGALFVGSDEFARLLAAALAEEFDERRTEVTLTRPGRETLDLLTDVTVMLETLGFVVFEFRADLQRQRAERDERRRDAVQAGNDLMRGLAHEIRNPLGGIRGAAQLLEAELPSAELREYTQVIVKEVDRLRSLVDRLLAPHRSLPHYQEVNVHEVCERVCALILAEWPDGLRIERDYDASLPDIEADQEQLIQALLNLARNAAQALGGHGTIRLVTRIARQVTIDRRRHRLALDLHVIDDGPGVDPAVRDRIFYPMVSTKEDGIGLGLTLAQSLVVRHGGLIECESRPGYTDFRILLPLDRSPGEAAGEVSTNGVTR